MGSHPPAPAGRPASRRQLSATHPTSARAPRSRWGRSRTHRSRRSPVHGPVIRGLERRRVNAIRQGAHSTARRDAQERFPLSGIHDQRVAAGAPRHLFLEQPRACAPRARRLRKAANAPPLQASTTWQSPRPPCRAPGGRSRVPAGWPAAPFQSRRRRRPTEESWPRPRPCRSRPARRAARASAAAPSPGPATRVPCFATASLARHGPRHKVRESVDVAGLLGVVDQGDQRDLGEAAEGLQQVIRADAIAAVRRVRQPVREEQQLHAPA